MKNLADLGAGVDVFEGVGRGDGVVVGVWVGVWVGLRVNVGREVVLGVTVADCEAGRVGI